MTSIRNYVYFTFNYPHTFIQEIWGEDTMIGKHLQDKFSDIYARFGSRAAISSFYTILDRGNQELLDAYIVGWAEKNM